MSGSGLCGPVFGCGQSPVTVTPQAAHGALTGVPSVMRFRNHSSQVPGWQMLVEFGDKHHFHKSSSVFNLVIISFLLRSSLLLRKLFFIFSHTSRCYCW